MTDILLKIYRGDLKPQTDLGIYFLCLASIPMRPPKSLDFTIKLSQLEFSWFVTHTPYDLEPEQALLREM